MIDEFKILRERTTVDFDRTVYLEELRRIFDFVSRKVSCNFDYTVEFSEEIGGKDTVTGERSPPECHVSVLKGRVNNYDNLKSVDFKCKTKVNYDNPKGPVTSFTGLKFTVTPGDDSWNPLEGMVSEDQETIDDVRKHIGDYFDSNTPLSFL